ncbi:MAG: hypothetical protein M1840_000959 [Geoglossum simile]|nr:MAG: hypothetical protein M1840_000959 [Geoglossum simile]
MASRNTITVGNLPESTREADIIAFFDARIKNAGIVVYSIMYDLQEGSKMSKLATVGLNRAVKDEALRCNGESLSTALGDERSHIEIVPPFLGVVTLDFHKDWEFEHVPRVYFVHDIGGDVYGSWINDSTGHMWIRDSLPAQCLNSGLRGRFSSLAYDASGKVEDIQIAAGRILEFVAGDRCPCSIQPIFFVCEGRGGIVLTQALTLLAEPAVAPRLRFMQQVRGIAYFGTPFQGTCSASSGHRIMGMVKRLARPALSSGELSRLMTAFNDIRNGEEIEVLVFTGESPDGPKRKTTRISAPPFQPPLTAVGINAGDRDMVKFASGNEAQTAITEIIGMIKGKRYSRFHTVFVIDDTGSMRDPVDSNKPAASGETKWDVLTRGMQSIGDLAAESMLNEVDIRLLNSTRLNKTNIASGQEMLDILTQVNLEQGVGGTYVETALAEILGPYVARYRESRSRVKPLDVTVKPLNVIVLTDGKAHDAKSTEKTIAEIGKKLDAIGAPNAQVRVVFLQVGDDGAAAEWLKCLGTSQVDARKFVHVKTFRDCENSDFSEVLRDVLLRMTRAVPYDGCCSCHYAARRERHFAKCVVERRA